MSALCTARIDDLVVALPVEQVREVVRWQGATAVPLTPPIVVGTVNLRSQVLTVVDLGAALGRARAQSSDAVLVVAIVGDEAVCLLADQHGRVLPGGDLPPPPSNLDPAVRDVVIGVRDQGDDLVLVLDGASLLERARAAVRDHVPPVPATGLPSPTKEPT